MAGKVDGGFELTRRGLVRRGRRSSRPTTRRLWRRRVWLWWSARGQGLRRFRFTRSSRRTNAYVSPTPLRSRLEQVPMISAPASSLHDCREPNQLWKTFVGHLHERLQHTYHSFPLSLQTHVHGGDRRRTLHLRVRITSRRASLQVLLGPFLLGDQWVRSKSFRPSWHV